MIIIETYTYECACGYVQDFHGELCPSCNINILQKIYGKSSFNIMEQSDIDTQIKELQSKPLQDDIGTGKYKKMWDPETKEIQEYEELRMETQEERNAKIDDLTNTRLLSSSEVEALTELFSDTGKSDKEKEESLKEHTDTIKTLRSVGILSSDVWY